MLTLYNVRRNDIHSPYMLATPVRVDIIVFYVETETTSSVFRATVSRCTENRLHMPLLINRHIHACAELASHVAYQF
jgi:hypothetical protein